MSEIKNNTTPTNAWERQRPDRLMRLFTTTPVVKWLLVSIIAHLLILGITSMAYIRDRIDPDGAEARAAAAQAASTKAETATEASTATEAAPVTPSPVGQGPKTEAELLENHKNAPVVQRITETAAPEDIPRQPDDLGLSLEDTHR